jgi:hypothetical protein
MHHIWEIMGQIRGPETCYPDCGTVWIFQSVQVNTDTERQSPLADFGIVTHIRSDGLFPYPFAVTYPATILGPLDPIQYNIKRRLTLSLPN